MSKLLTCFCKQVCIRGAHAANIWKANAKISSVFGNKNFKKMTEMGHKI